MSSKNDKTDDLFNGCFGCGTANPVGLKLAFAAKGDKVVADFCLDERYLGYDRFVHGGIIATLLDEAMGWAMVHLADCYGVTRNLSVSYRRPVAMNKPMSVSARILERNGKAMKLEAQVHDDRSRLLASATGDWVVVRRERAKAS